SRACLEAGTPNRKRYPTTNSCLRERGTGCRVFASGITRPGLLLSSLSAVGGARRTPLPERVMKKPRHLGRWATGGAAVAAFAAVVTAMNGAAAAPIPTATRPIPAISHHRLPILGTKTAGAIAGQYIVVLKDRAAAASAVKSAATSLSTKFGGTVRFTYTSTIRGYSAKM